MRSSDNQFWLGDEASLRSNIEAELKNHNTPTVDLQELSTKAMTEYAEAEQADFGEFGYMVSRANNLAIVTISGSLTTSNRAYNRYIGMVSYDEIRNAVFSAIDADGIEGIVLNMDTPGGQASGVSELSDFLSEVDESVKPIYTYTGTSMASGGYWLGSVGREVYASKLATVGSIGVITVHASYEKMYKDNGVEITVLRAGEFKALGSPYEKLDDKARSQIESQMNAIYDVFLETVAENRGTSVNSLKETAAEGRVFVGDDAVAIGLADHVTSFDAAIADISRKVTKVGSLSPLQPRPDTIVGEIDMKGKKKVLTEAGVAAVESGVPEAEVLSNPEMVEEVEAEVAAETEVEATAEGEQVSAEEVEGEEVAADPAVVAGEQNTEQGALVDKMFAKITDLTVEVADLTSKLNVAEQARDDAKSTEAAFVEIAVRAINKMQVSLGGVPAKMGDASAAVVLEQYNRTNTQFNQRFKVGAAAAVPENEDFEASNNAKENSVVADAVARLTTSKVQQK
ncbi:MAG: signal peptide peptidase SppA [Desulfobacteraceae bacterium]|nr:MAG: signal peptide peptidase SppA [Desulfobacteraceae bacterium]